MGNKNFIDVYSIIQLFLDDNLKIEEIAERTNRHATSVERILKDKRNYQLLYKEEADIFYEKAMQRFREIEAKNHLAYYIDTTKPRLRLDVFYRDEAKQLQFLRHLVLSFKTNLKTLAPLLSVTPEALYNMLIRYNPSCVGSIKSVLLDDRYDQMKAQSDLISFYNAYLDACKKNDIDEIKRLVHTVDDNEVVAIKREIKENGFKGFTDSTLASLLKYQFKYAISGATLCSLLGIKNAEYYIAAQRYLKGREEDKKRLAELSKSKNEIGGRT